MELSERSAETAGCDRDTTTDLGTVDFAPMIEGEETERSGYQSGCDEGLEVELWTLHDAPHIPYFSQDFSVQALDWLFRQSR